MCDKKLWLGYSWIYCWVSTSKFIGEKSIWRRLRILFDFKTRDVVTPEIQYYGKHEHVPWTFLYPSYNPVISKCAHILLHALRIRASIVFSTCTVAPDFTNDSSNNVIEFLKLNPSLSDDHWWAIRNFSWLSALIGQRNIPKAYQMKWTYLCHQKVVIEDCRIQII